MSEETSVKFGTSGKIVSVSINGEKTDIVGLENRIQALEKALSKAKEALDEISLCKGTFNFDPHKHAKNVIMNNKELAEQALSKIDALLNQTKEGNDNSN